MLSSSPTFSSIISLAPLICLLVPLMVILLSMLLTPPRLSPLSTSTLAPEILWMSLIVSPCLPMMRPQQPLGTVMTRLSSLGCWEMVCWMRISAI